MTPRSGTSWSTLGGPACEIRKGPVILSTDSHLGFLCQAFVCFSCSTTAGLFLGSIMALEHVSDYGISHVLVQPTFKSF